MEREAIGNIMNKTLEDLRKLADGETVVGREIIAPDGTVVIPISKITIGMVSGGGEYGIQRLNGDFTGAGVGGAGASVTPLGFLLLGKFRHTFIRIDDKEEEAKWLGIVQSVSKLLSKRKPS